MWAFTEAKIEPSIPKSIIVTLIPTYDSYIARKHIQTTDDLMPLKTFFSMLWDKSSYLVYTHIESEVIDQEGFDCEHKSTEQSRAQTVRTHKILTWAMPIFFTSCVAALSVASFYIGRRSVINEAQTYRTKSDFVFGDGYISFLSRLYVVLLIFICREADSTNSARQESSMDQ